MYDAIVIGARCAGSPTAMLLARKGYRVLLIDRATFPSDSMRNHFIRHKGTVQLHRWDLLDRVIASNCPPVRKHTTDLGDFPLAGYPPPGDGVDAEYGPRRYVLDKILVDAAPEAGAEAREGFSVSEVLMDGERVTGIRGKSKGGAAISEHARIVIGADGQHSLVARTVNPPKYNERPSLTCGYYSYWSGVPCEGLEAHILDRPVFLLGFPTNDNLTCIAVQVPISEFPAFRVDMEAYFYRMLDLAPDFAERVRAGKREERFLGSADLDNFFRKPYGPGWALVGDAGYHKDPITALGISDAFRDAELLADAIDAGLSERRPMEEALADYERQRNEAAMSSYEEACGAASFEPIPRKVYQIRVAIRGNQDLINRYFGVAVGTINGEDFFGSEAMQRLMEPNLAPDKAKHP
jgi:flavin-dependent dehydrogenase